MLFVLAAHTPEATNATIVAGRRDTNLLWKLRNLSAEEPAPENAFTFLRQPQAPAWGG